MRSNVITVPKFINGFCYNGNRIWSNINNLLSCFVLLLTKIQNSRLFQDQKKSNIIFKNSSTMPWNESDSSSSFDLQWKRIIIIKIYYLEVITILWLSLCVVCKAWWSTKSASPSFVSLLSFAQGSEWNCPNMHLKGLSLSLRKLTAVVVINSKAIEPNYHRVTSIFKHNNFVEFVTVVVVFNGIKSFALTFMVIYIYLFTYF